MHYYDTFVAEDEARNAIVQFGKELYNHELVSGSGGNLSIRLDDGCILFTPTGWFLDRLVAGKLSKIDPNGNLIEGELPTKEVPFHMAVYQSNPKARAVVHCHSIYATSQSCILEPWSKVPLFTPAVIAKVGEYTIIPYYSAGSEELAVSVRKGIEGQARGLLLGNHGVVSVGSTLEEAVVEAYEIELNAKIYFLTQGNGRQMSSEQIEVLKQKALWK